MTSSDCSLYNYTTLIRLQSDQLPHDPDQTAVRLQSVQLLHDSDQTAPVRLQSVQLLHDPDQTAPVRLQSVQLLYDPDQTAVSTASTPFAIPSASFCQIIMFEFYDDIKKQLVQESRFIFSILTQK